MTAFLCITDFVPYKWDENLQLKRTDFVIGFTQAFRDTLEAAKRMGLVLRFDMCLNQGLDIKDMAGKTLGHVDVWGWEHEKWTLNILKELKRITGV